MATRQPDEISRPKYTTPDALKITESIVRYDLTELINRKLSRINKIVYICTKFHINGVGHYFKFIRIFIIVYFLRRKLFFTTMKFIVRTSMFQCIRWIFLETTELLGNITILDRIKQTNK